MRRRASVLLSALLVGAAAVAIVPAPALASKAITHNASDVRLRVDSLGRAMVDYTDMHGVRKHILAWGAKNAIAPTRARHQRHFHLDCRVPTRVQDLASQHLHDLTHWCTSQPLATTSGVRAWYTTEPAAP